MRTSKLQSTRRFSLLLLLPCVLSLVHCGGQESNEVPPPPPTVTVGDANDPRFAAILAEMKADMQKHEVPGASVAVVLNGQLAFAAGLGWEKEGESVPVVPTTLFRVASMSKMVLAATMMKLVEEGKVDPTRPVTDYVPLSLMSGNDPSTVLVSDLLTHTSGIPDFSVATNCPTGYGQLPAYFSMNGDQPLWTTPGQVWNYSNQGFAVAGWVVEAASGQAFEDAVAARVFGPAGMTTATYDTSLAYASDHAVGHTSSDGQAAYVEPNAYDCEATRPPGGVIASVIDYAHFGETMLASGMGPGGEMLTPTSVATMETSHVDTDQYADGGEGYGYGLFVRDGYKGLHIVRHNGEDVGFQSSIWMVPESNLAVVVFYNSDRHAATDAVEGAVDILLGLQNVAPPVYATPTSQWSAYVGTYDDPYLLGTVTVTLDGGVLSANASELGATSVPLNQVAGDRFSGTFGGKTGEVTFYPDASGSPHWFVTRGGVGVRQ